jgi:hypothetical protein
MKKRVPAVAGAELRLGNLTSAPGYINVSIDSCQTTHREVSSSGTLPAPGQAGEALTDGGLSQIWSNGKGKFVSIEESLINGMGSVPHPLLLGNKSINLPYDKPAGSLSKRVGVTPPALAGCPDRSYQQYSPGA